MIYIITHHCMISIVKVKTGIKKSSPIMRVKKVSNKKDKKKKYRYQLRQIQLKMVSKMD
jgi:hypothetical protein